MTKEDFLSGVVFTTDRVGDNPFCYKFIKWEQANSEKEGEGEILRIAKSKLQKNGDNLIEWEHFALATILAKCNNSFIAYYPQLSSTGHETVEYSELIKV